MSFKTVKRLAARIAGCGENRVKILDAKKAEPALTADDVRSLIKEKGVAIVPGRGVGRGKARARQALRRKGRRRKQGSIKGSHYALLSRKERWLRVVRPQRKLLANMRNSLTEGSYRKLYRMIKGSAFPDKRRLLEYVKNNGLLSAGKKAG